MNMREECDFCGYTLGLYVELVPSLEDIFFEFIEETSSNIHNYPYQQWMSYFKLQAEYRTTCIECQEKI